MDSFGFFPIRWSSITEGWKAVFQTNADGWLRYTSKLTQRWVAVSLLELHCIMSWHKVRSDMANTWKTYRGIQILSSVAENQHQEPNFLHPTHSNNAQLDKETAVLIKFVSTSSESLLLRTWQGCSIKTDVKIHVSEAVMSTQLP